MAVHYAKARWTGDLKKGSGTVQLGKAGHKERYTAAARFENADQTTSPEELIGAANSGCFSMALAADLSAAGHTVDSIDTDAKVEIARSGDGFKIMYIELTTRGKVPGMSESEFLKFAEGAKVNCPVSQALKATEIRLNASLVS